MFFLAIIKDRASEVSLELSLMAGTTAGDQSSFARLYDRFAPPVYTLLLRMLKSPQEAEDVLQEVFLQIWEKASLFSAARGSVTAWIMTIARRKAIDHLRSHGSKPAGPGLEDAFELDLADPSHLSSPLNATISSEYESLMKEGLSLLSSEQKSAIELSYYEGLTQSEIAERLGQPLGTVKTRMRHGLMKLREYLKGQLKP